MGTLRQPEKTKDYKLTTLKTSWEKLQQQQQQQQQQQNHSKMRKTQGYKTELKLRASLNITKKSKSLQKGGKQKSMNKKTMS